MKLHHDQKLHGFTVLQGRETLELGGTLWELQHDATGARLAWLDNGESNKLFSIAFRTLPQDSTGVFHILEHSVLNGSDKYPVKEPFVNLLKSSMNTFLNAMTFPDKTVYPISSRNEQDFLNLTEVYLDAVFCPAIYRQENIFLQEGWHYELDSPEGRPYCNGVVFNEMKGAYSSPDTLLSHGLMAALYPHTCYGFDSGGHPAHIPELTYARFLQAHRDNYHPSNAYVYLDGAVPLAQVLEMLNGYFARFDGPRPQPTFTHQAPVPHAEGQGRYESEKAEAMLVLGRLLKDGQDRKKLLALSVLASYLTGSNESPLKKAILDAQLAQDAALFVEDGVAQPFLGLEVKQMAPENREAIEQLVYRTLQDLVPDKAALAATIDQMEFGIRDMGEPKGLSRSILALSTWLYGGDPLEGMTYTPLFRQLREELAGDYFRDLLCEIDFTGTNSAAYLLLPDSGKGEDDRRAEEARVAADTAHWTAEDRTAAYGRCCALHDWQATEDTAEALATLPVLPLSEISRCPALVETEVTALLGRPVLRHALGSGEVRHISLYFSLADCTPQALQQLSFMTNLFSALATERHSPLELEQLLKSAVGHLDFNIVTAPDHGDPQRCRPYFQVSCSLLGHKEAEGLALVQEILTQTRFNSPDSRERIAILAAQCRENLYQAIIAAGNRYAAQRASAHWFAASAVTELVEGYEFYRWLCDLDDHFDAQAPALQTAMDSLCALFCRERMTLSLTAGADGHSWLEAFPAGKGVESEWLLFPTDNTPAREAILIPAAVSYAAACGRAPRGKAAYSGAMEALGVILNYDYLWSEVRVKGGAYGCGFRARPTGGFTFTSYRDPSPLRTLDTFRHANSFLTAGSWDRDTLHQYIIGAAAGQEPLVHDRTAAQTATGDFLAGVAAQDRIRWRRELLELNVQALLECGTHLEQTEYAVCVVGSREALEGAGGWQLHSL